MFVREAGMNECHGALHTRVGQVREECTELIRGEHPLVDNGLRRKGCKVHAVVSTSCTTHPNCGIGCLLQADLVFRSFPEHVGESVEVNPGQPHTAGVTGGQEDLPEGRFSSLGGRSDHRVVNGKVTPAEHFEALFPGQRGDGRLHRRCITGIAWKKAIPVAYSPTSGRSKSTTSR